MFNPQVFFEAGRARSGTALFNFLNTTGFTQTILISTRVGDAVVTWGFGGTVVSYTPSKNIDFVSSPNGGTNAIISSGVNTELTKVKLFKGLSDVYSLQIGSQSLIPNLKTFIDKFINLYSLNLDYAGAGQISVTGNLEEINVERIFKSIFNTPIYNLSLNFSNFPITSKLKYFNCSNDISVSGDVAKIPPLVNFFKLQNITNTPTLTYTSGKVWASSFDTLHLPIALTVNDNNNILIDANNSITTAIGGKYFNLPGGRTSISDVAVAGLISKGFTVDCKRFEIILDLPLQNSFTEVSGSGVSVIAGNGSGLPSFVSDGSGGYAVDFTGSKSLKTSASFPINTSNKLYLDVDIKTTATATQVIAELSANFGTNNAFGVFLNDALANRVEIADHNSGFNLANSAVNINTGSWVNVKIVLDRSLGEVQNIVYINNSLSIVYDAVNKADLSGNFGSFTLFIGQRNGSSLGYVGQMKNLKIFR